MVGKQALLSPGLLESNSSSNSCKTLSANYGLSHIQWVDFYKCFILHIHNSTSRFHWIPNFQMRKLSFQELRSITKLVRGSAEICTPKLTALHKLCSEITSLQQSPYKPRYRHPFRHSLRSSHPGQCLEKLSPQQLHARGRLTLQDENRTLAGAPGNRAPDPALRLTSWLVCIK